MNLQQELERAIGDGPPLPTPEQRLGAGRDALRRRRISVGAAAAAVLVAIAAPFALAVGGDARSPDVANSPSAPNQIDTDRWSDTGGFGFDLGGTLQISPDAVVHDRRDDLVPGAASSVALDLTFRGDRTWHAVRRGKGGTWVDIQSAPGIEPDLYRDFDDFVAKTAFSLEQEGFSNPSSLALDVDGGMPQVAGAGTSIGPVVREGQRAFGYEVGSGDERQFVLLRPTSEDTWRVEQIEEAATGSDLASWLRGLGWLPTGEEAS